MVVLQRSMKWSGVHGWCRSDTLPGSKRRPVFYGKMIYLIPDSHQLLLWQTSVFVPQQTLQSHESL